MLWNFFINFHLGFLLKSFSNYFVLKSSITRTSYIIREMKLDFMFYIFLTCMLMFIWIKYYLPSAYILGFNMAIIDSTPKHNINQRFPNCVSTILCKVDSTISIKDYPIVSPQSCWKPSPLHNAKPHLRHCWPNVFSM